MNNSLASADKLTSSETADYKRGKYKFSSGLKDMAEALEDIRNRRLYREEYSSFEEFCQAELKKSHRYADRLISTFRVNANLMLNAPEEPSGSNLTQPKVSQQVARELAPLPPEQQREVFQEAKIAAPNGRVTTKLVKGIVEKYKPPKKQASVSAPKVEKPIEVTPMKTYFVYITRVEKLIVEVEADSPERADQEAWDAINENAVTANSDQTIDYIVEENSKHTYYPKRDGTYETK